MSHGHERPRTSVTSHAGARHKLAGDGDTGSIHTPDPIASVTLTDLTARDTIELPGSMEEMI